MVFVPSQSNGLSSSSGLLQGNLEVNGMPEHRKSSFQVSVDGSVARVGRRRKLKLQVVTEAGGGSAALGESECAEDRSLNTALKEVRCVAQGRLLFVQYG